MTEIATVSIRFTVLSRLSKPTGKSSKGGDDALFKIEIKWDETWITIKNKIKLGDIKKMRGDYYDELLTKAAWDADSSELIDTISVINLRAIITKTDLFPGFKPFLDSGSGAYPEEL
jgi:hypothetical protein